MYSGVKCYALLSVFGLCWLSNVLGHGLTMSGFLSRWKKVCRVYWAIISTISCHLQIVALTAFCVMSHCDLDLWRTNLKIHRVNARGTACIQAMFRCNSLKNKRENGIRLIWNCWIGIFYFVSWWPWPLTCALQHVYSSSTCHYLLTD